MAAKKQAAKKGAVNQDAEPAFVGGENSGGERARTSISNCQFIGVQYDAVAAEVITTIAEGLVENARALGALAHVLRASNVHIDALVRVGCPTEAPR